METTALILASLALAITIARFGYVMQMREDEANLRRLLTDVLIDNARLRTENVRLRRLLDEHEQEVDE